MAFQLLLAARDATEMAMIAIQSGTGARRPVHCTVASPGVNFDTCNPARKCFTWWNPMLRTTTPEAAHAMPWRTLKKIMTDKYCPRGEIKKLEFEIHELMDKKIKLGLKRQADNKRKSVDTAANNQNQQTKQEDKTLEELMRRKMVLGILYGGPKPLCQMAFQEGLPKIEKQNNGVKTAGNAQAHGKVFAVAMQGEYPDNMSSRYSANVRSIVADFSHVLPNGYSPRPNDKEAVVVGVVVLLQISAVHVDAVEDVGATSKFQTA
ncbi:hypothetical protein Tco_0496041 [Tanacetum coccineum]